jgi:hypothetical protein
MGVRRFTSELEGPHIGFIPAGTSLALQGIQSTRKSRW